MTALAPPGPKSLATVVNRCTRSIKMSFTEEKGREGCLQEQDCFSWRFQVTIANSPHTGRTSYAAETEYIGTCINIQVEV